jgi:cytochrome c biogenesis protein CcmG, thiol:disulfide interchange protein DsbE
LRSPRLNPLPSARPVLDLHDRSRPTQAAAFRLAALLVVACTLAPAQDAAEILRRTAETYRSLHSFEASGVLRTQTTVSGVPYEVTWPVSLAQADSSVLPPDSPVPGLSPLFQFGVRALRGPDGDTVRPEADEPSAPKGWAQFDHIDRHVRKFLGLSSETIEFEGGPRACWVVEVAYEPGFPARALADHPLRYWIDRSSHLVLRESFGRRDSTQSLVVEWVFQASAMKVNEPPPAWAIGVLPQMAGYERSDWIERQAPEFALADLGGRAVRLTALRGKAVLLSFWASWCIPCKEEMPLIEELAAEFRPSGLIVWGITNESAAKARAWLEGQQRALPTLVDANQEVFRDYEAEKIPVSVVVDRGGRVVSYRVGLSGETQLRAAITKALASSDEP